MGRRRNPSEFQRPGCADVCVRVRVSGRAHAGTSAGLEYTPEVGARVLLVVIDAATPHVVCPAIRPAACRRCSGLPTRRDARGVGRRFFRRSRRPQPRRSPPALSGRARHRRRVVVRHGRQEVAYYGDDFWVIAREGFRRFLEDFLLRLNGDRLRAPTLFEMIERTGRRAACLNYLVFRGLPHEVRIPGAIAGAARRAASERVLGPSVLALGDFVVPRWARARSCARRAACSTASAWTTRRPERCCADLMARRRAAGFHDRVLRRQRLPQPRGRPVRRAAGARTGRSHARRGVRGRRRHRSGARRDRRHRHLRSRALRRPA